MAELNFGGVLENVMTSKEFSLEKAREVLKNETIAVLGYGVQGPGQACNLRDNGFNVIVGQREGKTYEKAVKDGWVPGETLFSIEEAAEKGTIVCLTLTLTNDYVETVVTKVASLTGALNTVTKHCDCFIFQYLTSFLK